MIVDAVGIGCSFVTDAISESALNGNPTLNDAVAHFDTEHKDFYICQSPSGLLLLGVYSPSDRESNPLHRHARIRPSIMCLLPNQVAHVQAVAGP